MDEAVGPSRTYVRWVSRGTGGDTARATRPSTFRIEISLVAAATEVDFETREETDSDRSSREVDSRAALCVQKISGVNPWSIALGIGESRV